MIKGHRGWGTKTQIVPKQGMKYIGLMMMLLHLSQAQASIIIRSDNVTFPPYRDMPALFGPPISLNNDLGGVLKLTVPADACSDLEPPDVDEGMSWVALIKRSKEDTSNKRNMTCTFVHKVMRAEKAGAVAAIVYDNVDEPLRKMIPLPWDPDFQPHISSVFVSEDTGEQLKKIIALASDPRADPIVLLLAGSNIEWISVFTSTTIGLLAIGTVMVLFIFARQQQFGFGRLHGSAGNLSDLENNRPRHCRKFLTLTVEQVESLPKVLHECDNTSNENDHKTEVDAKAADEAQNYDIITKKGSDDTCAVCLDEYECGDSLRELPCGHRFHIDCIDEWLLKMQPFCPLCKIDVGKIVRDKLSNSAADPDTQSSSEVTESTPLLSEEDTPEQESHERRRPRRFFLWRRRFVETSENESPLLTSSNANQENGDLGQ